MSYEDELNSIHNDSLSVVDYSYNEVIKEISKSIIGISLVGLFSFSKFKSINIDSLIGSKFSVIDKMINSNTQKAFDLSNSKNDNLTRELFKKHDKKFSEKIIYRDPNKVKSFFNNKIDNLTISDRVWNVSSQFKYELESAISAAFSKGMPKEQLAKDIQKYLNNPDMRFRKIRDKFGDLKPSSKALTYNPGQGVYRNSRANAIRLARETINRGYREAEYQNFKNNPFIVAFDIKNTERKVTTCKLCEQNAGRYPKTYKFIGWHVGCMCSSYPVFCSDNDFDKIFSGLKY